jgi:GH15 family glucan-1,4-alpha-glucosidase
VRGQAGADVLRADRHSLDHAETGAILAAATSSLPEWPGTPRNWDYRYTWVRDASFSNYVFRRIGDPSDADVFLAWVLTTLNGTACRT